MKEGMLEVLIYLFENYIFDELSFDPDQEELAEELEGAGFPSIEIDKAFGWLEDLLDVCEEGQTFMSANSSTRFYHQKETLCLGCEGIELLTNFVDIGVLNQVSREMVIDRVMALGVNSLGLDHIRWIVLLVLSNQPGFDEISEWAEELITQQMLPVLH